MLKIIEAEGLRGIFLPHGRAGHVNPGQPREAHYDSRNSMRDSISRADCFYGNYWYWIRDDLRAWLQSHTPGWKVMAINDPWPPNSGAMCILVFADDIDMSAFILRWAHTFS